MKQPITAFIGLFEEKLKRLKDDLKKELERAKSDRRKEVMKKLVSELKKVLQKTIKSVKPDDTKRIEMSVGFVVDNSYGVVTTTLTKRTIQSII